MDKFCYKAELISYSDDTELLEVLNKEGQQGWEAFYLISYIPKEDGKERQKVFFRKKC